MSSAKSHSKRKPCFKSYAMASAAAGSLALTSAQSAHADFVGPYAVVPPPTGIYSGGSLPGSFGNWNVTTFDDITGLSVDTSSAPVSIQIESAASDFDFTTDEIRLLTSAVATGLVEFDYNFTNAGNSGVENAFYFDGTSFVALSPGAGSIQFSINAGEMFGFSVSSSYLGTAALTISNFSGAVPEPSSLSLLALGFLGLLSRRVGLNRKASKS